MIKVIVSRESVCAGDDGFAPNAEIFEFEENTNIKEILKDISKKYIPSVKGGSTWSIAWKNYPLAIVTKNDFLETNVIFLPKIDYFNEISNELCLYFNLHGNLDENIVYNVLKNYEYYEHNI